MEMFEVTFLGDDDSQNSWQIRAESPESALEVGVGKAQRQSGTYSVWDSHDPLGMPLLERVVK